MKPRRSVPKLVRKGKGTTPKIALQRSEAFDTAVRRALAEMEADPDIAISPTAAIKRAKVNRSTLYTTRKDEPFVHVHQTLIQDIDAAAKRRAALVAKPGAARGEATQPDEVAAKASDFMKLANEAVIQRSAAQAAARKAILAERSTMQAVLQALSFLVALRTVWPAGKERPAELDRTLRELKDKARTGDPEGCDMALREGRDWAKMFESASGAKSAKNSGVVRPIRGAG